MQIETPKEFEQLSEECKEIFIEDIKEAMKARIKVLLQ
jgi:hypothetical protein